MYPTIKISNKNSKKKKTKISGGFTERNNYDEGSSEQRRPQRVLNQKMTSDKFCGQPNNLTNTHTQKGSHKVLFPK